MAADSLDNVLPDPYWIGAQICTLIAATGGQKTAVEDWIPSRGRPVRIMSGEHGRAIIQGLGAAMLARNPELATSSSSA